MAPPLSSLYTISFALALLATLIIAASLRLLAILPNASLKQQWRKRPIATRVLIVLGSGGHTHEMFHLLKDLDTRKYTYRTYIVSSGDAFSAQRAEAFEKELEERELKKRNGQIGGEKQSGNTRDKKDTQGEIIACVGPNCYDIAIVPRARKIHQPLLTTPITALYCLWSCFAPLLSSPPIYLNKPPRSAYETAAGDLPDLIITNGPATAVIVILASLILRFLNFKGANSRHKCKTIYAESFARVKGLSLSGKLLSRVVDRFLVQWEELEGAAGGRAEYWGVLV